MIFFVVVHQAFNFDAAFTMLDNKGKILLQETRFFFLGSIIIFTFAAQIKHLFP